LPLWQAKGIAEPWTRPEFIDAIVSLQQTRERRAVLVEDTVQFHDRSVVCTAALADYLGFPRPHNLLQELDRVKAENIFQSRVLFLKNLGFITATVARRITYKETVRFEEIHERTYREFGFEIIPIDPGSVSERVKQIKRTLSLERT
jgi:predicted ATPase